ncbi:MAG: SusE domain-containing protein [Bacteroidales bacterium]|nr:SusE domain-containing protein [Bacteroidales bacterium]
MKKIFNTILAGAVALAALSCTQEELTTFHPTDQVAPILDAPSSDAITLTEDGTLGTFSFTPASYGVPAAIGYTLYADVVDNTFANEKVLGSAMSPAKAITVAAKTLNSILISAGYTAGAEVPVYLRLKSEWRGESTPVASGAYALYSNVITLNAIPYEAEKEFAKVWLPGTANGWDHKVAENLFNFDEDDVKFEGVTDFGEDHAENAFKLTGAAAWDDATGNWGSTATAPEAESIQLENGINDNITVYTKNRYYHFTFNKTDLTLKKDYSFDKVGVIGLNGDWDNDIVMTWHSAKQRFYADVEATSDTKFKFRLDGDWAINWGGDLDNLTGGGADIPISAGQYRIYLNLNDLDGVTGEINADMYGKEEGVTEV